MQIEFTDKCAEASDASGDVTFQLMVEGRPILCIAKSDALQDVDPDNAMGKAIDQYRANCYAFQSLAEQKILARAKAPAIITQADVLS